MTSPDPALVERIVAQAIRNADLPEHLSPETREYMMTERPTETDMKRARAALAALRESGRLVEDGARWRHVKRGTFYTEIGRAELQMAADVVDGSELVIYRGNDGKWWARQEDEFYDGRFIVAPPATAATEESDGN